MYKIASELILRKKRNFGQKINDTFEFIAQHKTDLYRVILFIVCPIALLSGVLAGYAAVSFQGIASGNQFEMLQNFRQYFSTGPFWITVLTTLLGYNAIIVTCNVFIKMVLNKERDLSVSNVWKNMIKYFLPTLGAQVLLGALFFIIYIVLGFTVGLFAAFAGFLAFFALFGLLFGLAYFGYRFLLVYPIMIIEGLSFGNALSRAFTLVKGHWWGTFSFFTIQIVICTKIWFMFFLPQYVILILSTLNELQTSGIVEVVTMITSVISSIGTYLALPIVFIAAAIELLSLAEEKENVGLLERIAAFENQQVDDEDEEIY